MTPGAPNPTTRVSLGIASKMALLCSFATLIPFAGAVVTYLRFGDALVQDEYSQQNLATASIESTMHATISDLREDVASLAAGPSVTGVLRAQAAGGIDPLSGKREGEWRRLVEARFRERLAARTSYSQVRLIGVRDNGREIIRVERQPQGMTVVVPDELLQAKGDRPYFQRAIVLSPGKIYVSQLELNEEHGQPSTPYMPVLRAAIPIYPSEGQAQAIVIINNDLTPLLSTLFEGELGSRYKVYLCDSEGQFLLHPDPRLRFGPQLGSRARLADEFPGLSPYLEDSSSERIIEHVPTGQRVVANLRRLYRNSDPKDDWRLLLTSNLSDVTAEQSSMKTQMIVWGSLLLTLALGTAVIFSRSITRPLRQITVAVERFGQGEKQLDLPLDARDEAGVLARSFDEMSRKIQEHNAEMTKEVRERRNAEDALRAAERQLRLALDAAQAGVWAWNLENDSRYRDEAANRIFGLPSSTNEKLRWTECLHPADRAVVEENLRRAQLQNVAFDSDFRIAGENGSWKHIRVRAVAVTGPDKQTVELIGVCWDVSAEKALQKRAERYATELKRTNDELEQLVYSVSHDLKSPLVTCKGYLGLLKEDLRDGQLNEALDSIGRLEKAADYMNSLIGDLLEFSRSGRITVEQAPVDVAKLVGTIVDQYKVQTDTARIQVEVKQDVPEITGDPKALTRLFQNLIGNAIKYGCGGEDRRVEIGGLQNDNETVFYVRDYGPGIAPEYHDKVFGLFQRLQTTHEGTGIGLAVVKKIVESSRGRVWVESADGKGATFWVAFPRLDQVPNGSSNNLGEL